MATVVVVALGAVVVGAPAAVVCVRLVSSDAPEPPAPGEGELGAGEVVVVVVVVDVVTVRGPVVVRAA